MLFEDRADDLIQISLYLELIACGAGGERFTQTTHQIIDTVIVVGKQVVDENLVVCDILDNLGTGVVVLHEDLKIKHHAVIDAVYRCAAVQDTICDEDNISRVTYMCLIVDRQMKAAGQDSDDLVFRVPVIGQWEMLAYVICGILVGIAAIFFVGAYTTVQPGYGDQYNNEAIAGCVMGGTSMAGGLASIGGTVIGVFIISLLQEGILALGINKNYQLIITGLIVIVAVYADVVARRRKN